MVTLYKQGWNLALMFPIGKKKWKYTELHVSDFYFKKQNKQTKNS